MDLLKAFVPSKLKELYKLKQLKVRYPYSIVQSTKVGENVCIGKGSVITNDVLVQNGVVIGNYTYINNRSFVFSGKIGNFCSISYNVTIGPANHPLDYLSTSPFTYCKKNVYNNPLIWKDEYTSPPIIGNDVLIGVNAVILQGVTIGDGAVVAAGAIVNRDVPPYTIVGGVPAKIIKRRFSQKVIDRLLELKWWQLAPEDFKQYMEILNDFEEWKNLK